MENGQVDTETIVGGVRTGRETRSGNRYHTEDGRFTKKIEAYDKLLDTLISKNISYFPHAGLLEPQYLVKENRIEANSFDMGKEFVQRQMVHELGHALDHLNNSVSRANNELSSTIEKEGNNLDTIIGILEMNVNVNRNKIHELLRKKYTQELSGQYRFGLDNVIKQKIREYDKNHPDIVDFDQEEQMAYSKMKDALKSANPDFFAYLDPIEKSHNSDYWKSDRNNRPQEFFANVAAAFLGITLSFTPPDISTIP